jgi:hypothetical protein
VPGLGGSGEPSFLLLLPIPSTSKSTTTKSARGVEHYSTTHHELCALREYMFAPAYDNLVLGGPCPGMGVGRIVLVSSGLAGDAPVRYGRLPFPVCHRCPVIR